MPLKELSPSDSKQTTPETFTLVLDQVLAQNAAFSDVRANIDGDGDFTVYSVYGSSTGAFSIKFRDAKMRDMSSAEKTNVNAVGTAQFPVPYGEVRYPSQGQISFSITNLYAGQNTIQICLEGIRHRKS